ncbi:MAG: hypothetical protein WD473_04480 [Acidimicrobiia bacterium]
MRPASDVGLVKQLDAIYPSGAERLAGNTPSAKYGNEGERHSMKARLVRILAAAASLAAVIAAGSASTRIG